MTDWLPWGLVLMVAVFWTLASLLRVLGRTTIGATPDLRPVWRVLGIGAGATLAVYLVYIVFQERWLWY